MTEFIFLGERRSPTAIRRGWSWQSCQQGEPHLCARQLFTALRSAGIEPREQRFANLWSDDGSLTLPDAPGLRIVALGDKVSSELSKYGVEHVRVVHPAARGKWRRQKEYSRHVREVLTK